MTNRTWNRWNGAYHYDSIGDDIVDVLSRDLPDELRFDPELAEFLNALPPHACGLELDGDTLWVSVDYAGTFGHDLLAMANARFLDREYAELWVKNDRNGYRIHVATLDHGELGATIDLAGELDAMLALAGDLDAIAEYGYADEQDYFELKEEAAVEFVRNDLWRDAQREIRSTRDEDFDVDEDKFVHAFWEAVRTHEWYVDGVEPGYAEIDDYGSDVTFKQWLATVDLESIRETA